jgi:hypothetical protein
MRMELLLVQMVLLLVAAAAVGAAAMHWYMIRNHADVTAEFNRLLAERVRLRHPGAESATAEPLGAPTQAGETQAWHEIDVAAPVPALPPLALSSITTHEAGSNTGEPAGQRLALPVQAFPIKLGFADAAQHAGESGSATKELELGLRDQLDDLLESIQHLRLHATNSTDLLRLATRVEDLHALMASQSGEGQMIRKIDEVLQRLSDVEQALDTQDHAETGPSRARDDAGQAKLAPTQARAGRRRA